MDSPSARRVLGPRIFCLLWLVPALMWDPAMAAAQEEGECDVPSYTRLVMTTLSSLSGESLLLEFQYPVIWCPGGVRISADSARVYEATNYNQLFGNVVFLDGDSRLSADQAQYFTTQRRLVAQGNTVLTDLTEGSVIRGDNMTLIRAGPQQAEDYLLVTGRRPHATLYPALHPDTTLPDTMGQGAQDMPPDSVRIETDPTMVAPDSTVSRPDTAGLPPDSVVLRPDSTVLRPDSARPPPDSVVSLTGPPRPSGEIPPQETPNPPPQSGAESQADRTRSGQKPIPWNTIRMRVPSLFTRAQRLRTPGRIWRLTPFGCRSHRMRSGRLWPPVMPSFSETI